MNRVVKSSQNLRRYIQSFPKWIRDKYYHEVIVNACINQCYENDKSTEDAINILAKTLFDAMESTRTGYIEHLERCTGDKHFDLKEVIL